LHLSNCWSPVIMKSDLILENKGYRLKTHVPKTARKIILAVAILVCIFVVTGAVYVYLADQPTTKHSPAMAAASDQGSSVLASPVTPGPDAPEGVAIQSVTSPVVAGSNSSMDVETNAGSICTILVTYNGIQSTDSGLVSKTADEYGSASWAWTVGSSVPIGNWPIRVTCTYHGRSGVALGSIQVTK
jgi:hypothetical protein